jgi:hypothetical protein
MISISQTPDGDASQTGVLVSERSPQRTTPLPVLTRISPRALETRCGQCWHGDVDTMSICGRYAFGRGEARPIPSTPTLTF